MTFQRLGPGQHFARMFLEPLKSAQVARAKPRG